MEKIWLTIQYNLWQKLLLKSIFAQKMAFNLDSSPEVSEKTPIAPQLTQEQLVRIETNRKRAMDIKKSKENAAKM